MRLSIYLAAFGLRVRSAGFISGIDILADGGQNAFTFVEQL